MGQNPRNSLKNMITKIDYYLVSLVGFLAGVFAVPTAINLGIRNHLILFILPLVFPILFVIGLAVVSFLSRFLPFFAQFGKFAAVGLSSTAIDFGVLNILSLATGITAGFILGGVNIPGFGVAVFNSYFWNKFWTFKAGGEGGLFHDFSKFLAVAIVGLVLNSGIVIFITTYLPPFWGLSPETHLNIAKVIATLLVLVWNFLGLKFIVFRK